MINIESEKVSWLNLMIEYVFTAQERNSLSFEEAINSPEKEKWKKVIYEEYHNLKNFGTFTIIFTPSGTILINGKNILHREHDREGNLAYYEAKYVIQDFKQKFGIYYTKTFVPTVHLSTLRLLLSITVVQANVKNTYLYSYSDIYKIFYMFIPSSWTDIFPILSKYAYLPWDKLCSWVWRPLYKSKQRVHCFYKFLVKTIVELGFTITQSDKAIFYDF